MRVISGDKRGHKLKAPKGSDTRPTEDKIKESLFNIIRPFKYDSVVLDLFAGSGSIGIEFLSRGSKEAYLVDSSIYSIDVIKENLAHTRLKEKAKVLKIDARRAIEKFKEENIKFDYIYLDPPYKEHELLNNIINKISNYNLLENDGILIIEHEKELILENTIFNLTIFDNRNYGSKSISMYKRQEV